MMSVNAILHITVLSVSTWIQPSQKRNGDLLVVCWPVLVFKAARVALGAGAAKIVVVAQLGIVFAFLDVVQRRLVHMERRVDSTRSGVPGGGLGRLGWDVLRRDRHGERRRRGCASNDARVRRRVVGD